MSGGAGPLPPFSWNERARGRLVAARRVLGHSQSDLALRLQELGAPALTQPTISAWESGRTHKPGPEYLDAIGRYCEEAAVPEEEVEARTDELEGVWRSITEEPLLGEMQRAVVEALTARLAAGPPLTPEDLQAAEWLQRTLRLSETT
jgi:transcriptional regulator with XRE-family HTH domain